MAVAHKNPANHASPTANHSGDELCCDDIETRLVSGYLTVCIGSADGRLRERCADLATEKSKTAIENLVLKRYPQGVDVSYNAPD